MAESKEQLKRSLLVMALVLASLSPRVVLGQTSIVISADQQFRFAESYFAKGEYYRAISEYERFIYFFPQDDRVELATYTTALSFLNGERFKPAIQAFRSLIGKYHDTELSMKSYLKISECYVKQKDFSKALSTLDTLVKTARDHGVKDEALYRQGWIYLEMDEWEKARGSFDKIAPGNRDMFRLKQLSEAMSKKSSVKEKNPTTAGLLAVIPGAGHLYCKRYRDALIAFLLNGAMIYAACEAFDHDNEGLGGLITFFEIGLYSGNIYSAVSSAHKYNRKQKQDFLKYLKEHSILEASAGRVDAGLELALVYKITF